MSRSVDLKLPGQSGFEVCRAIRAVSDLPIVIVTAQVDSYDVVAGLEAGADDYVTKPFVPKVLTARIRALLRRVLTVPSVKRTACASGTWRSRPVRVS